MRIKDLIKYLKTLPQDNEAVFRLWDGDDNLFSIHPPAKDTEFIDTNNHKCSIIAIADNCIAHKVYRK